MLQNPVFILGTQRSGTSLIRSVLHNHSFIGTPQRGEIHFFKNWNKKFGEVSNYDNFKSFKTAFFTKSKFTYWNLSKDEVELELTNTKKVSYKIFYQSLAKAYLKKHNKKLWCDKSTSDIEFIEEINSFFPNFKAILVIRDPRDVYYSTKNAYWRKKKTLDVVLWALTWNKTYNKALQFKKNNPERIFIYKHEEFVQNPGKIFSQICKFLKIPYEKQALNVSKIKTPPKSSFEKDKNINNKINTESIGRWKKNGINFEIYLIEKYCNNIIKEFYYFSNKNKYFNNLKCLFFEIKGLAKFYIKKFFRV